MNNFDYLRFYLSKHFLIDIVIEENSAKKSGKNSTSASYYSTPAHSEKSKEGKVWIKILKNRWCISFLVSHKVSYSLLLTTIT